MPGAYLVDEEGNPINSENPLAVSLTGSSVETITGSGEDAKTLADIVTALASVGGGTPGVSVSATQTRPNNTTGYSALDVVGTDAATNLAFENILTAGAAFIITGAKLRIDINAIPSGMLGFRLHLYNAAPTAITDNAAYNLPSGDRAKYLGYLDFLVMEDMGDTLWAQATNTLSGKLAAESTTLYGILQTIGAYTPAAQTVHTAFLDVSAL